MAKSLTASEVATGNAMAFDLETQGGTSDTQVCAETANRYRTELIEFIDLIINHLAEQGFMDPVLFYGSPSSISVREESNGCSIRDQVTVIFSILDGIRQTAAARSRLDKNLETGNVLNVLPGIQPDSKNDFRPRSGMMGQLE